MSTPTKRFNVAAGRPYTTRDGEEKKAWVNLGRATQWDDGGISIELHAVPVGNWFDGKISLFPEDKKEDQGQQRQRPARGQQQSSSFDESDSEIPF
ncbi:hypothetical protein ACQKIE_19165 [Luteibacter sp. NPDC031894]|uniref:hypothetical protein n=1 Tax=Luteibacter sp. NPDC031894 TaxID=3390572 RepID=UPI003CFCF6B0